MADFGGTHLGVCAWAWLWPADSGEGGGPQGSACPDDGFDRMIWMLIPGLFDLFVDWFVNGQCSSATTLFSSINKANVFALFDEREKKELVAPPLVVS